MITFLVAAVYNLTVTIFFDLEYSKMMFSSFALAYATFIISAFLLPDNEGKKVMIRNFFTLLNTPIKRKEELVAAEIDKLSMLWFIGKMSVVTGLAICLLVLINQPLVERLKIVAGGGVVLGLGLFMLWADMRSRRTST